MRACLVIAIFFVALAVVTSAAIEGKTESPHLIEKRGVTIQMKPPQPQCVFYECIARCKQRGYKSGGYCTMTGCQCLR